MSFWVSRQQEQNKGEGEGGRGGRGAAGIGLLGAGLVGLVSSSLLSAEEKKTVEEKKKSSKLMFGKTAEDRIRQYATADNVFDHFASYQLVSETGVEYKNLKLEQMCFNTFFFREKDDNDEHPKLLQCHDSWKSLRRGGQKIKTEIWTRIKPFLAYNFPGGPWQVCIQDD